MSASISKNSLDSFTEACSSSGVRVAAPSASYTDFSLASAPGSSISLLSKAREGPCDSMWARKGTSRSAPSLVTEP